MSLFRCEQCGCRENTAYGFYATRFGSKVANMYKGRALCSECGPSEYLSGEKTRWGKWHGHFEKISATGYFVDVRGFLVHPSAVIGEYPVYKKDEVHSVVNEDGSWTPIDWSKYE